MTARLRDSRLETRTARRNLPVRRKPYYVLIAPGISLGYRRNQGAGSWIVRVADGKGGGSTKAFAIADDFEDADAGRVLTYWQAQTRARALARGGDRPFDEARRKFLAFVEQGIEPACYLYRHYHPNGDLLYVGVSMVPVGRQRTHFRNAEWNYTIHQIVIEPFATRDEALAAERLAIETEFPKFNTVHNARRHPLREIARVTALPST